MDIEDFKQRLDELSDEAEARIEEAETEDEAIKAKNEFLGREGKIQELSGSIGQMSDPGEAGREFNAAKTGVEERFEAKLEEIEQQQLARQIEQEAVDVTLPARRPETRPAHPLVEVDRELTDIFEAMGFEVAMGPDIETDFYNFEALNFPKDHPARDMQDTFKMSDGRVLRTHTSPVQIRTMLAYEPPIRIVSPGRTYRCDADMTHSPVFHQIECLMVDEDVTFADLKGTLTHFAEEAFGEGTDVRFRPSYFPFTEPSAEVDIGCLFCGGEGEGCRVCGDTGWLEILGAGMVDPNVFEAAGVDSDRYSGFAFGLGIERVAMLTRDVDDIRLFYDNDLRFLEQF
jgi:phenylalanyl-tRNA synthetase alpha chain